ncbi:MAG: riboflavin synthase subunit alpha [Gammaproteobacteria bacterium]|nr:MAG: riboflavin synthase subunit alpha [Gammaproteobacteria bacterium]
MFTGIVLEVGRVEAFEARPGGARLTVAYRTLPRERLAVGDSVAVNGVCLTVVENDGARFAADLSEETLARTTLGRLAPGAAVDLEPAATPQTALGGHWVSGHVDGVGEVLDIAPVGDNRRLRIRLPADLVRYVAVKGSITVDGVSLTVNAVEGEAFEVMIIPHTLARTVIGGYRPGTAVNIEVDILARYLERLLQAGEGGACR